MAGPKGSWEGSTTTDEDIQRLRRARKLPPAEEVAARAPGDEVVPAPEDDEFVVFTAHFSRGFGLPASAFFRRFLQFFGLQPHHLGPNSVLQVASFAALCEGYLGLLPTLDLFCRLFYFRQQSVGGEMCACGAAAVYNRSNGGFPKLPLLESAKKWQRTFFYVKNVNAAVDRVNLPFFDNVPPVAKPNWGLDPKQSNQEINAICERLERMQSHEGLVGTDFVATFIGCRVQPLQRRPHRICDMSGRHDPCRLSTVELKPAEIARRVNNITQAKLSKNWFWGKEPYCRDHPAPAMFSSQQTNDGPHPRNFMPDRLDSDGEEDEGDEADEGAAGPEDEEHPEGPGAGGSDATAHLAVPTGSGTGTLRRLRKTAEAPPAGGQTAEVRPHGKQPAGAQPAEAPSSKKIRAAGHGTSGSRMVPKQPAARKRRIPVSVGVSIKFLKTSATATPGDAAAQQRIVEGTGEHQPADAAAEELAAQQAAAARREEAARTQAAAAAKAQEDAKAKAREDAAAKGGADAPVSPAQETNSPPPSPPRENRSKRVHDPARRVEADARAGGAGAGETAGQDTVGSRGPATGQTATSDVPPAADLDEGAGQGNEAGRGAGPTSAGGGAQQPGAEATPVNPDAIILSSAGGRAPGRSFELRRAASGSSSGSMARLQREWASAGELSSGTAVGSSAATVALDTVQAQFAGHRDQLKEFAKDALGKLLQLEQSVAAVTDKRTAIFNNVLTRFKTVKAQHAELAGRLQAQEEELRQARAAAADPAEVRDLRLRLSRAGWQRDQLQEQVRRLTAERDRQAAELKRLAEEHDKVVARKDKRFGELSEQLNAATEDYSRRASAWSVREQGLLAEVQQIDTLIAKAFPDTQRVAEAVVQEHRDEQRALGVHIGEHVAWTVEEIVLAAEARLLPVGRVLRRLRDAGLRLVQNIWPTAVMPCTANRLARWLEVAPERVDAWRASAARAGAEMALGIVLSWYPDVDLARLDSRRAGAEGELAPLADAIGARASYLASYAAIDEFVKERAADEAEIPEDTFGLALDYEEGSAGETGDEETGSSAGETGDEETGSSAGAYAETPAAAETDAGATTSAAAETGTPGTAQPGADAGADAPAA